MKKEEKSPTYHNLVQRKVGLIKLLEKSKDEEDAKKIALECADIEKDLYQLDMADDPKSPALDVLLMSRSVLLARGGKKEDAINELDNLIATSKNKNFKKWAEHRKKEFSKEEEEQNGN